MRRALLVCSPGGHLAEMLLLEDSWQHLETSWVTLRGEGVDRLLAGRRVTFAHGPTNRSIRRLILNFFLAWRVLRRERPDAILSTGAGVAVPFFIVGRMLGCRLVFVESFARTSELSLSGRLVYPVAHEFFVQWPDAARGRRKARYRGGVIGGLGATAPVGDSPGAALSSR